VAVAVAFQLISTVVLVVDKMVIPQVDRELALQIKVAMVVTAITRDQRKVTAMAVAVAVLEPLVGY
jgi:hypothetical protein